MGQHAQNDPRLDPPRLRLGLQVPVGPVEHHLVRVGEAVSGREDRSGVADRYPIGEEPPRRPPPRSRGCRMGRTGAASGRRHDELESSATRSGPRGESRLPADAGRQSCCRLALSSQIVMAAPDAVAPAEYRSTQEFRATRLRSRKQPTDRSAAQLADVDRAVRVRRDRVRVAQVHRDWD
jgi:hypothetical protein